MCTATRDGGELLINRPNRGADFRWLFIIDAIITLPIAVAGFFLYPNLPLQGKKTWWLTDDEFQLSRDRLNNIGRAGKTPWSWAKVRRLASSWHTWILRESSARPSACPELTDSDPLRLVEQRLAAEPDWILPQVIQQQDSPARPGPHVHRCANQHA